MGIEDYLGAFFHKGERFTEFVQLEYRIETKSGISKTDYVSYWFEYHPEMRKWSYRESSTDTDVVKDYFKEDLPKIPVMIMNRFENKFLKAAAFYNRIYKMLQRTELKVVPIGLTEPRGKKVMKYIETFCEDEGVGIDFGMNYEGGINHFNINEIGEKEEDCYHISLKDASEYPCIQKAFHYICNESEYRLKLLMD